MPGGKVAEAIDVSFKPLEVGQQYVLFLKFIPSTGAYRAVSSTGSFQILGSKVTKLTEEYIGPNVDQIDAKLFFNELRTTASCNGTSQGGMQ